MPKMKTHRGAAKRVSRTGSGKIKIKHANTSHLCASKTQKRTRHLRHSGMLSSSDYKRVKQMIAYV